MFCGLFVHQNMQDWTCSWGGASIYEGGESVSAPSAQTCERWTRSLGSWRHVSLHPVPVHPSRCAPLGKEESEIRVTKHSLNV